MKQYFQYILLIALSLTLGIHAQAQHELSTHFTRGSWQASFTNPALIPDANIIVALPGIYGNLHTGNLTYNNLITEVNGGLQIDFSNAISEMEIENPLNTTFTVETLGLGLRLGGVYLGINHAVKTRFDLNYPKTLAQLIWEGNSQFVDEEISFGPNMLLSSYHELGLAAGMEIGDVVSVGARVKLLSGIANVTTERNDLSLYTDPDIYQTSIHADFLVNTSNAFTFNDFQDFSFNPDFSSLNFGDLFGKNTGIAFDLGATFRINKLQIRASAIDIGKINWEDNVNNYSLEGEYNYEGLDVLQDALNGNTGATTSVWDSLQTLYQPMETQASFSSQLPTKFYVSGVYDFSEKLQFGALLHFTSITEDTYSAIALSANYRLNNAIQVGGVYAIKNGSFTNLGVNLLAKAGPVQIMAATDNLFTVINPKDSHTANARVGLNIVLGKKKDSGVSFY